MSEYEPLQHYLQSHGREGITLSFDELALIVGDTLPESARKQLGWWANDVASAEARGWLGAGYVSACVSLASETVTFIKAPSRVL